MANANETEEYCDEHVFEEIQKIVQARNDRLAPNTSNDSTLTESLRNYIEIEEYQLDLDPSEKEPRNQQLNDEFEPDGLLEKTIPVVDVVGSDDDLGKKVSSTRILDNDVISIKYNKRSPGSRDFWVCPYCPYKATKRDFIHAHIPDTHASVTCYKCQDCQYAHPQLSLVIEHVNRRHQKLTYQCPDCKYKFTTIWNCEGHILIRHPKKAQKLLNTVLTKKELDGSYKRCPFCDFENNSSAILKRHVERSHPEVITYKCLYCTYKNLDIDDIADHMSEMHPEETGEVDY